MNHETDAPTIRFTRQGLDERLGLSSARAFQQRAEDLPHIVRELPEGTIPDATALGEVVAGAANLAFALELYLKTLLSVLGQPVPRHHDLARLYEALPRSSKDTAAGVYVQIMNRDWVGRSASVSLALGAIKPPPWNDSPIDRHLAEVLNRSRDAFQAWRYALEIVIPPRAAHQVRHLEYGGLLAACETFALMLEPLVDGTAVPVRVQT